jgi:hypothetical protein
MKRATGVSQHDQTAQDQGFAAARRREPALKPPLNSARPLSASQPSGSICGKSGPPTSAHECRRRLPTVARSAQVGLSLSPRELLLASPPSLATHSYQRRAARESRTAFRFASVSRNTSNGDGKSGARKRGCQFRVRWPRTRPIWICRSSPSARAPARGAVGDRSVDVPRVTRGRSAAATPGRSARITAAERHRSAATVVAIELLLKGFAGARNQHYLHFGDLRPEAKGQGPGEPPPLPTMKASRLAIAL